MRSALGCALRVLAIVCVSLTGPSAPAAAQRDLRRAHEQCIRSVVRITTDSGHGTGWVTMVGDQKVVVTAQHVVDQLARVHLSFYDEELMHGDVVWMSARIDLAVIVPERQPDVPALPVGSGALIRGERVVLGGNPGGLSFVTTEGVVAGVLHGSRLSDAACGEGNNCVIVDAESEPGSSGGPIVDADGRVVGMLWGIYAATSLSIGLHASTLASELLVADAELTRQRRARRRAQ